jgi:pimeloyl-ACP methyl ester carboxylesterase
MPMRTVNGAELYHEVRGEGPPLLCIMGTTGDAGHFERLAGLLVDKFTVVTYDRRGNGRSPRPPGWEETSPEEQADDAAALLEALGLGPAAVFGTSSGGTFALCLLVRHPRAVRGAILHEPVLARLYDDPEEVARAARELVRAGMAAGGPPEALRRFWLLVGGEANWDALDPELRARMLASAATFFGVELGTFERYLPTDDELDAIAVPVEVLVSERGRVPLHGAARRLAARLGVPVTSTPGTHTAYGDHPLELAETLRRFLRQLGRAAWPSGR